MIVRESYEQQLARAVGQEIEFITNLRETNDSDLTSYARFTLDHFFGVFDETETGSAIQQIGAGLLRVMDNESRPIDRDSAHKFNKWDVKGWRVGTAIMIRHDVIAQDSVDAFNDYLAEYFMDIEHNASFEIVDEQIGIREHADLQMLILSEQVRDVFIDDVQEHGSEPDDDAFRRGIHYAFELGFKFLSEDHMSLDDELAQFVEDLS